MDCWPLAFTGPLPDGVHLPANHHGRETPHPVAQAAAHALLARLQANTSRWAALHAAGGGKMFGVLVVAHRGALGYLQAFSGMLENAWQQAGFVGPAFDEHERARWWPDAEQGLRELDQQRQRLALTLEPQLTALREQRETLPARHAAALATLKAEMQHNQQARTAQRTSGSADTHGLAEASRADKRRLRDLRAAHADEATATETLWRELRRPLRALESTLAERSQGYMRRLHDGYLLQNFSSEQAAIRDLFPNHDPPGGAGDCAAPKLLHAAAQARLTPLALAEVWVGSPLEGRRHGAFYPPCKRRCEPLMAFFQRGLHLALPSAPPLPTALTCVFEDASCWVIDKPVGMLAQPGKLAVPDVQSLLRRHWPEATVVHRLDQDTSGLMIVAKQRANLPVWQRMFAERLVEKTYEAVVHGQVAQAHGELRLPLRPDFEHRPRQIVDAAHGKAAHTSYAVLSRTPATTRLALTPHTGRTHQLRVHCALGLQAPIIGDALYGPPSEARLHLHAKALRFMHPLEHRAIELGSAVPF